jgi:hypothetical protein
MARRGRQQACWARCVSQEAADAGQRAGADAGPLSVRCVACTSPLARLMPTAQRAHSGSLLSRPFTSEGEASVDGHALCLSDSEGARVERARAGPARGVRCVQAHTQGRARVGGWGGRLRARQSAPIQPPALPDVEADMHVQSHTLREAHKAAVEAAERGSKDGHGRHEHAALQVAHQRVAHLCGRGGVGGGIIGRAAVSRAAGGRHHRVLVFVVAGQPAPQPAEEERTAPPRPARRPPSCGSALGASCCVSHQPSEPSQTRTASL